MTLPPIKAGARESVGAYVLRRLLDAPGPVPSNELHIGAPDYMSGSSPSTTASHLYKLGILGRMLMEPNGTKGIRYLYYIADLDLIPKDFCWEFRAQAAHHGPRNRTKVRTPSDIFNTPGAPPDAMPDTNQQEPDMAPCTGEIASTPYIPGVTAPASVVATRQPEPVLHGVVDDGHHNKPQEPLGDGPYLVLATAKGSRRFAVAEAKALYAQLKEVFG